ncbi:MAG: hypothetical protein ABS84_05600 [Rubrivivax sp. SCN 71-131]|nr:MAG: hypothetical protein ABS84_05600 [Rubrivivax sp. SCN 71-131]
MQPVLRPTRRAVVGAFASLGLGALPLRASALAAPTGPIVLTITGRVRSPNAQGSAEFDMAMLQQLPQTRFTTGTPWYAQPREFAGPLLRDVLREAGAHGTVLHALALNDYRVDIPMQDAQRFDVIIARLLDGRPMSVRNRGPLFIVYPFDAQPELHSPVYFTRSAWQLRSIEVA